MKLYKLTDSKDQTRGATQWGRNVTHTASGEGYLCGPGWIHAYEDPFVAVFMNPIHAQLENPHLWLAEGEIGIRDGQFKCGTKSLTTLHRMRLPRVTVEHRVRFAILCTKAVCTDERWNSWADGWMSGKDRTNKVAAYTANQSAYTANAVMYTAYTVYAVNAAHVAYAAVAAANAAAYAATYAGTSVDLIAMARKAIDNK